MRRNSYGDLTTHAPAIAATGKITQMLGMPNSDRRVDWSTSQISRIAPDLPTRSVIVSGEVRLLLAILKNAIDDCARLAKGLPVQYSRHSSRDECRQETERWIADDSDELRSLGWLCDCLSAATGRHWRREAVAEGLRRILNGEHDPHQFRVRRGDAGARMAHSVAA